MTSQNTPRQTIRCAIYTRKSTEEGLQQDFNTLDAQRESAEAYIVAHKHEGWVCLPERYDDGGYTGGNLDRPAFQRLMHDVEGGKIDAIVIYKIDRLSRSLMDFSRVMETLERHNVALIAITQALDTKTSMGRLTLNILLSFAQFERELISERTRDKIAAARRKGKFAGGRPLLGYDIQTAPGGSKLIINKAEAKRVNEIFELFIACGSLIPTVRELNKRGWHNKTWTSRAGQAMGGRPFDKPTLYRLLCSVVYLGKITHGDHVYAGEHEAIVPQDLFNRVQSMLRRNKNSGGKYVRNKHNTLLKGLVRCTHCGCGMSHHYTTKNGITRYRYYVCNNAQKRGWASCPWASVPAPALEKFVVDQLREMGRDPVMFRRVLHAAQEQITVAIDELKVQRGRAEDRVRTIDAEIRQIAPQAGTAGQAADRLATLQDDLALAQQEVTRVGSQILNLERRLVNDKQITQAMEKFDPVWDSLSPTEQASVVHLLVEQVCYDGQNETVSVVFRGFGDPGGSKQEAA